VPDKTPRPGEQHPEIWRRDLNPQPMAGQNVGLSSADRQRFSRTAHDVKEVHDRLRDYSDDDLKQIPILATGARLEQGATYIDLQDSPPHELTATGDMEASATNLYVPKDAVDYQLWNRLIGIRNPERLGM
jgi:hypothetical protein